MVNTPDIQLVVFDLGRVLLRIADDWNHAAKRVNHPELTGLTGDLSTAAARGQHHPLADLLDRFEVGQITPEAFFTQAADLTGHPPPSLRDVMDAVLIETFPGVPELLAQLHARSVQTACLSNTNARHWQLFTDPNHPAYLPLDRLDFPLGSQLVGHAKPHPAIYQHLESLSQTPPHHILFFDDLEENLTAAADRGWHTVLVPRLDNPIPLITQHLHAYRVL